MKTSASTLGSIALAAILFACGAPTQMGAAPYAGGPAHHGHAHDAANACDPEKCSDFCYYASGCITPGDLTAAACEARCNEVCGNAYFDDRDASLMKCVTTRASVDLLCTPTKECCAKDFTSELCREVQQD